jgi:PAS domain S-box-containing protein
MRDSIIRSSPENLLEAGSIMSRRDLPCTNVERCLAPDDLIVSKTDIHGKITYVNRTFLKISGYSEEEVFHQPHAIVRHPAMPRVVFKLLWDTIRDKREIFAYVKNRAKNGDFYWVFAHVTPSYNEAGQVMGYHSNRRMAPRPAIRAIESVYRGLCAEEAKHQTPQAAMAASGALLGQLLAQKGISYEELVFAL